MEYFYTKPKMNNALDTVIRPKIRMKKVNFIF